MVKMRKKHASGGQGMIREGFRKAQAKPVWQTRFL